jgi:hypothetical protein
MLTYHVITTKINKIFNCENKNKFKIRSLNNKFNRRISYQLLKVENQQTFRNICSLSLKLLKNLCKNENQFDCIVIYILYIL